MSGNQKIACSVKNCKHNDKANFCTLSGISVGSPNIDAHYKRDTECTSFEADA